MEQAPSYYARWPVVTRYDTDNWPGSLSTIRNRCNFNKSKVPPFNIPISHTIGRKLSATRAQLTFFPLLSFFSFFSVSQPAIRDAGYVWSEGNEQRVNEYVNQRGIIC